MTKAERRLNALKELARTTSVMIDGEEVNRVITERAMHYIVHPDPKHRYMAGDYYDVEHGPFLRVKKTLMRLAQLVDFPCDMTLWLTVRGVADRLTVVTHNGTLSRWYQFGGSSVPAEGALADCLRSGEITKVLFFHEGCEPVVIQAIQELEDGAVHLEPAILRRIGRHLMVRCFCKGQHFEDLDPCHNSDELHTLSEGHFPRIH